MSHYTIDNKRLTFYVTRSPLIIRMVLLILSFLFFLMPTVGMLLNVAMGNGVHFGFLMVIAIFGIIGFYLLRMTLWNTYGKEEISFHDNQITYLADYGWFKDAVKTRQSTSIGFEIKHVGYDDEFQGVLLILLGETEFQCATKMHIDSLEILIEDLDKQIINKDVKD